MWLVGNKENTLTFAGAGATVETPIRAGAEVRPRAEVTRPSRLAQTSARRPSSPARRPYPSTRRGGGLHQKGEVLPAPTRE